MPKRSVQSLRRAAEMNVFFFLSYVELASITIDGVDGAGLSFRSSIIEIGIEQAAGPSGQQEFPGGHFDICIHGFCALQLDRLGVVDGGCGSAFSDQDRKPDDGEEDKQRDYGSRGSCIARIRILARAIGVPHFPEAK